MIDCWPRPEPKSATLRRRPTPISMIRRPTPGTGTGTNMPVIWMPWVWSTTARRTAMPGATSSRTGASSRPSAWNWACSCSAKPRRGWGLAAPAPPTTTSKRASSTPAARSPATRSSSRKTAARPCITPASWRRWPEAGCTPSRATPVPQQVS